MQLPTQDSLIAEAAKLPQNPDRAVAFPLGASTFRALLVDRYDKIVNQFELKHPVEHHETIAHATAAALVHFGCRPVVGAAFFAGMLPKRGFLEFTNLKGWPRVDPTYTYKLFGFKTEWMNDGTAGYYGLPRLNTSEFAILREGDYHRGDTYIYAIFGTGMNAGAPTHREDGHLLFVPKSDEDRDFQLWFKNRFGHWPEAEDVSAGGSGIWKVAEYFIAKHKLRAGDDFLDEFQSTPELRQAEVVTAYAMKGQATAKAAAEFAFGALGSWLGSQSVSHQASRIDLSPGILSDPKMRKFVLEKTNFLKEFEDQGRPMFKAFAQKCTVRVCLRNPESEGAVERAAELLRARAD